MFDFCKLDVYQKSKSFCISITKLMSSGNFDSVTNDQLRRASFSIMLNIAEGSSRFSNKMLFSLIQHLERKWRKRSLSNILSLILTNSKDELYWFRENGSFCLPFLQDQFFGKGATETTLLIRIVILLY